MKDMFFITIILGGYCFALLKLFEHLMVFERKKHSELYNVEPLTNYISEN